MKPVTDPTPTTRTPLPAAAPLMVWHRRLEGADVDGGLHDSPDARALLAMWRAAHARAEGRLPGRDFVSNARAQHDAWLALLAPQEGAGFRLCHYGTALSQASGMATQREDYEGLPTEERNFFEVWLSDVLAAGAPQVLEHVAFRPHAVFLWTRLGLPVRDEQDQPALLVFSHPAQRRHEWLDAIFAATGDATVGLHEIAGPHPERPHWLVVAATPAFLALARARPGHVQGRLAHEVFERWTELRFDVAAQATRAAGERSHVFELNDTQRGELREFAGVATRLDDGCVLRLAEVTVARRRERGLRQTLLDLEAANTRLRQSSAAASEASRAKSSFLATMSHEIRTPMNGVIGMVELLALGKLDEEQAHAVGTIRASAHALLRIIDDILDFSKIEAGQLGVERVPVNLMAVVEGACDALVPVAEQRKVALRVFVAPALITPIVGDATRLRQVLTNLIGNAIKFSAGEPERQAKVRVRAEIEAGRVRIDVVDNGIGMNPDAIERIFEPFVQAEASTTRRFGGSGLGLAITRRLVELMGGRIGVKSEPGRGTAFSVWLPRKPAPNSAVAPVSLPDLRGLRVAIVVVT